MERLDTTNVFLLRYRVDRIPFTGIGLNLNNANGLGYSLERSARE